MIDSPDLLHAAARAFDAVPPAARARGIVAAVSGGTDSTALALLLDRLVLRPLVAHVDHATRPDSSTDAELVERLAARLGLPFALRRLAPGPRRSAADLRDARYAALVDVARDAGAGIIATAHHRDDLVETILFRIGRGTGVHGLVGIPRARELAPDLWLVRPLLDMRRAELELLCRDHPTADDPTNSDRRFARNRIRHVELPALRSALGADLDERILRLGRAAGRAADAIDHAAREVRARTTDPLALTVRPEDSPRVLAAALRLVHRELAGTSPLRTWLDRAVALRTAPAGTRLAGPPPTVTVVRTPSGLSIRPDPSHTDPDVRTPPHVTPT